MIVKVAYVIKRFSIISPLKTAEEVKERSGYFEIQIVGGKLIHSIKVNLPTFVFGRTFNL